MQRLKGKVANSIIWRTLDHPGHESARLFFQSNLWNLQGTAVFSEDELACRLDYHIRCDSRWHTRSARVDGWIGDKLIDIKLAVDDDQHWVLNGADVSEVAGCIDLDLNFSPSTNLLPIRRLNVDIGQQVEVRAAWLLFPSFTIAPLSQVYQRIDETTYRYESGGGSFVTELSINATGFITRYPGFWEAEVFI